MTSAMLVSMVLRYVTY